MLSLKFPRAARWGLFAGVLVLSGLATAASAQGGVTIYGVTTNDRLVQFNSATPCVVSNPVRIRGLQADEKVVGIDFRPATGQLYAVGSSSQLYTIDLTTAVATPIGAPLTPALDGSAFGVDFNPVVDRLRIVSNTGQNLRVHPDTGATIVDGPIAYSAVDANFGMQPAVAGVAYTNPDRDALTGTELLDIDVDLDILTQQVPANDGTLITRGPLTVRVNDLLAFDIALLNGVNTGYAALKIAGGGRGRECGNSSLAQINLATGAATVIGSIGTQQPITGLAVYIAPPAQ